MLGRAEQLFDRLASGPAAILTLIGESDVHLSVMGDLTTETRKRRWRKQLVDWPTLKVAFWWSA